MLPMSTIVSVQFHGNPLLAVQRDDGVFVAINPICRAMGVRPEKQAQRIKADPILCEGSAVVAVPSPGGMQDTFCLRLDLLNGWLFTIDESRVTDAAVVERILDYKRECYRALAYHFQGRRAAVAHPSSDEPAELRRRLVTEARHSFDRHAARELWFQLGLPIVPSMVRPNQAELFTYTATTTEVA